MTGLSRIVLSEPNPTDFQYLLQDLLGERSVEAGSFGFAIGAANAPIEVATPEGLALRYGARRDEERGLRIEGLVLATAAPGAMATRCREAALDHREIAGRLVVALGANAFLAFEDASGAR